MVKIVMCKMSNVGQVRLQCVIQHNVSEKIKQRKIHFVRGTALSLTSSAHNDSPNRVDCHAKNAILNQKGISDGCCTVEVISGMDGMVSGRGTSAIQSILRQHLAATALPLTTFTVTDAVTTI